MKYVITVQKAPEYPQVTVSTDTDFGVVDSTGFRDADYERAELHELFWALHDILGLDLHG